MRMIVPIISCIAIAITLFSCTNENERLDYALNLAGKNRKELEKVLKHYKDDSLKYQATQFLIENMPYHHYYDGAELKKYYRYYEVASGRGKEDAKRSIDSLKQTTSVHLNPLTIARNSLKSRN